MLALGYGGWTFWRAARVGAGYTAKILCSAVFVSRRDPAAVRRQDLARFGYFDTEIDRERRTVTAALYGFAARRAVFRDGLGCTLAIGKSVEEIRAQETGDLTPRPAHDRSEPWPLGDGAPAGRLPAGVDVRKLAAAVDDAFAEPDPRRMRRTRAVVVVYRGHIVAEQYAAGISPDTPLAGWSMTKSVTNALVGIMVARGKLAVGERAPVAEWTGRGDGRGAITLDQLLRMSSGLEFGEEYVNPLADAPIMLFGTGDVAAYAIGKPLEASPDEKWYYSSGTTNIIARIIRDAVGGRLADSLAFPRRALFDAIDMRSAVMEPDASGTFVASSFMYASARDWARFGLLYLQDGVWAGERILPEGWVQYTVTPTPKAPLGRYGAHFWLNAGEAGNPARRWLPRVPRDAYSASGFEGQYVTVIPSWQLVIVRLGLTRVEGAWDHDAFIAGILEAIGG